MKTKRNLWLSGWSSTMLTAIVIFGNFAANAQDMPVVVLHEGKDYNGDYQEFPVGNRELQGDYIDNRASSITVPNGLEALVCDEKPVGKFGGIKCTKYPEGNYRFQKNDKKISYIEVRALPKNSYLFGDENVCLFSGADGTGYMTCLKEFGEFRLSKTVFPNTLLQSMADKANASWGQVVSSIRVSPKIVVTLKKSASGGSFIAKKYKSGFYNLNEEFSNNVSKIKIETDKSPPPPVQTQKPTKPKP